MGFPYEFVADEVDSAFSPDARNSTPVVLDIGCGTARVLKYLSDVHYIGIEPSARYLETARACFPDAEFQQIAFQDLDASAMASTVDVALSVGVLHHISDDDVISLSEKVATILKPEGKFISFDPVLIEGQHRIARLLAIKDRGNFVRTAAHLVSVMRRAWGTVEVDIREDLRRYPYSSMLVRASI